MSLCRQASGDRFAGLTPSDDQNIDRELFIQQWFALSCIRDWWSVARRSDDDAILSRYPAGPTSFRVAGIDADTCRCEIRLFFADEHPRARG